MRKLALLFAVLLVLLLAVPVLAAGLYRSEISVQDTSASSRTGVPVLIPFSTELAVELGYLDTDCLDARFFEGTTELPFMLADDKIGVVISSLQASQEKLYRLETGYSPPVSSLSVVPGYSGYITYDDASGLEPGKDFDIEFEGWVAEETYFPVVRATATSTTNTLGTSHTVSLPGGIESGDLLIMVFGGYTLQSITIDWPGGWTNLAQASSPISDKVAGVAYRVATGSEGSTATVTTDYNVRSAHQTFRITGYQDVPKISGTASDADAYPNSSALSPSWGSHGILWLSFFGSSCTASTTMVSCPTSYSNKQFTQTATSPHGQVGSARRELEAASENPGSFTMSGGVGWYAWTVGVQGRPTDIINKGDDFRVYVDGGDVIAYVVGDAFQCTTSDGNVNLWGGGIEMAGQRLNDFSGTIEEVLFYLEKDGTPPGTVYARVRAVSGDSLIGTLGSVVATTLQDYGGWVTFDTTPVGVATTQDVRVVIEYTDGDSSNNIEVFREYTVPADVGYWTEYDGSWTPDDTDSSRFQITIGDATVTAVGAATDEHVFKIWSDGSLRIDIDGDTKDSEPMSPIPDNSDDWVISIVGFNYYEHTVSDTLIIDYEPVTMIIGTVLPDKHGSAQNGVIFWGANEDLDVEVSGLVSITDYTSDATGGGTYPDITPDLPDLDLYPEEPEITTLPWYDLVSPAALGLGWGTNTLYSILFIFVAIGVGVGVMIATGSALLGAIGTGAGLAVAAGTGSTGWWVLIVYMILVTGYLVSVRSM